jgi:hypothetical protein
MAKQLMREVVPAAVPVDELAAVAEDEDGPPSLLRLLAISGLVFKGGKAPAATRRRD